MSIRVFDAHLHIIDSRFPVTANQGFVPDFFSVEDYLAALSDLQVVGGAVIGGSFQGYDPAWLIDALARLGPGFVGVMQLPADVDEAAIMALHDHGVRAVRFNLFRGTADVNGMRSMARRVYDLVGWHSELYLDAKMLRDLNTVIGELPAVCIDHLGMESESLPGLLRLAQAGVKIKASGFGRVDLDVLSTLKAIYRANPDCLVFGTDLPGTRATRRFQMADIALIQDAVGEEGALRVLLENGLELYGRSGRGA